MITKNQNLNKFVSKTATQWKERAAKDRKNRRKISRAQEFALSLMDYMDDQGIKQKELARLMDVTPQQVNKILRAKSNLTFETIDKIEEALGVTISTPQISVIETANSISSSQVFQHMQVVHKTVQKDIQEDKSTTQVVGKTPLLQTTIDNMNDYTPLLTGM
jgi:transcriptional regulator with XRE-family HTH domain